MGRSKQKKGGGESLSLKPETKKSIAVVTLMAAVILMILAAGGEAGPAGRKFYEIFSSAFGLGYYLFPVLCLLLAFSFLTREEVRFLWLPLLGGAIFILSGLGLIDIVADGRGGLAGNLVGTLERPFGAPASIVITATAVFISLLIVLNKPIRLPRFSILRKQKGDDEEDDLARPEAIISEIKTAGIPAQEEKKESEKSQKPEKEKKEESKIVLPKTFEGPESETKQTAIKDYILPPADLLVSSVDKPTIGDLKANANIVKRTLESFGIAVEMGEINVGPAVTRYTLKPAEGIKLSRITSLNQDLALALAAHPIRIEAPIPGKSLVGIEVPNKAAALVRLGSLILYPSFQQASPLTFALGRNVNGEPVYADIGKMPHLLIAGATGSGKSIALHCIIVSLLYKNSPEMLKFILIDPKRVELSEYNNIPHLLSPVITDTKKSLGALRWILKEMERRYLILEEAGTRDIKSYNKDKAGAEKLPYIILVIDELADVMASYGREVEGSIIRIAQMARATGIHLIVSTQRPSVEVITGLIKANITSRIGLQVASQIDSRTILDAAGAEKLLGSGDLLFMSSDFSKPRRIQGSYLSEEEVKKVVRFIKKNNRTREDNKEAAEENLLQIEDLGQAPAGSSAAVNFDDFGSDEEDELYEEAVETIRAAKRASSSFLQRRLKIGYARAARLLDIMEERGVVGPGEGAKPREVL